MLEHYAQQYEVDRGECASEHEWRAKVGLEFAKRVGDYILAAALMLGKPPEAFTDDERGLELAIVMNLIDASREAEKKAGDTFPGMFMEHYELFLESLGFTRVYQETYRTHGTEKGHMSVWACYPLGIAMKVSTSANGAKFDDNRVLYEFTSQKPLSAYLDRDMHYLWRWEEVFGTESFNKEIIGSDGSATYLIKHQKRSGLFKYIRGLEQLIQKSPFGVNTRWKHLPEHSLWLANFEDEQCKPEHWLGTRYFEDITRRKIEVIGREHPEFLQMIGYTPGAALTPVY